MTRDEDDQTGAEAALRGVNERFRLAQRATRDAIWDWDLAANHVLWNEALADSYGWRPDQVAPTGDWWIARIHPGDRDRIDRSIHAVIDGSGTTWTDEYRFERADGSYAAVLDRGYVIRGPDGRASRMIGAMLDLSERKATEAALRQADERLRLATSAGGIGIFDYDVRTGRLTWDDGCRALFGLPPGAPVSYEAAFLAGLHPDDRQQADGAVRCALDTAGPGRFSAEYRTIGLQDGIERWVSARGETHFQDGAPQRLVGTVSDITDRKRAELALQALNAGLEQQVAERTRERDRFWRLSRDPFMIADAEGRWLHVSPAWTGILGWTEAELLGRTSEWMEHPDDRAKTRAEVDSLAHGETTLRFENRFRTRAGDYRWFSWTAVPAEGGQTYCTARDVTEEKALAAAQARLEDQLRQSHKMEAVGQLTGGLAHDFNNLLAGISGSLELMNTRLNQGRLKDVEKYMVAAQGAARRAAALTHRLLAFARRQTLAPKATNVNALVRDMLDLVRRTVGPGVQVETVLMAGLWATLVDQPQLENALLNLCINARDAMPDGGRITIETGNRWIDRHGARQHDMPEGQYLSLCVSDTGTGMTPDVVAKAFDPFFTTKPIGQGTGLGLSMIYGFAKQSGGQVRIYSEPGEGTMVCIYLPRHRGAAEHDEAPPEPAAQPVAEAGETVLVVDDEPTVRMLVTDVLGDLGYAAIEAADGPAGLQLLQSDMRIDLLVTDVGLPGGMNGRQMADAARVQRPELKVLFITGFAENALLNNGQLEPGMAVLTKPFAVDTLAARIRELISP